METRYIILLGEFLHIPGRGLRMHLLRAVLLSKDIGADRVPRLFQPEFLEQTHNFWININRPYLAALERVKVNALFFAAGM